MADLHRVVIVGGGFAGLNAALTLRDSRVSVTVVDRRNFHLFQPLLYQVATGALSPADIASPLRHILKKRKNVRVLLAEVMAIDTEGRKVVFEGGGADYDTLIVATGSRHHYFGRDEWEEVAPGLKDVEDATEIRARILLAFEKAELECITRERVALLTFVIVGGGPTGVELAGAVSEVARDTLRNEFGFINPEEARIILIEGMDRVLPTYPLPLSRRAEKDLIKLGVVVRTRSKVTQVERGLLKFQGPEGEEEIRTHTILWAAGNKASPLGKILAERCGAALDKGGRVMVEPDLSLPGHPEIFVLGDLANFSHQTGKPLPGVAPVAMQEGRYVAKLIQGRLRGEPVEAFSYWDRGDLATIGRSKAVARLGRFRFTGILAWLLWLFVHLLYIVEFENRVLVLIQWGWNYFTFNRSARLITGAKWRRPPPEN